jgi:hypothetical protein
MTGGATTKKKPAPPNLNTGTATAILAGRLQDMEERIAALEAAAKLPRGKRAA